MKMYPKLIISFSALYVSLLSVNPAYAYLDPGTGSMLVQALLAVVAVITVSIGIYWRRLKSFWSQLFGPGKSEEHNLDDN